MQKRTLLISAALITMSLSLTGCWWAESKAGGAVDGKLAPCPDSPNCVSTQADPTDSEHYMDAIPLTSSPEEAQSAILAAINDMPRSTVITADPTYIHAEFRSALWRFVDDVEFHIDADAGQIHFRSASRLGYSDVGVNRARMGELTAKLQN